MPLLDSKVPSREPRGRGMIPSNLGSAMAFAQFHIGSNALEKQTTFNVLLPNDLSRRPLTVMFLLHGQSDDHTAWCRQTSIERYVQDLPLIVVMPDGLRNYYTDAKEGFAIETYIFRELVDYVSALFPTRSPWCATGLSMGGYGAVKLGLRRPDLFQSVVSHSGAVLRGQELPPDSYGAELRRIFGPNSVGGPDDLLAQAKLVLESGTLPKLRLDCGKEDFLLDENRRFHKELVEMGFPHEYEEFPGDHNWGYWDLHVQEAIAFHRRNLGF